MSLRDIRDIMVWERRNERGAFSVKIVCVNTNHPRFKKSAYKFFKGECGIWQAAAPVLIRQADEMVYRKVCKLIHAARKRKEKKTWTNPLFSKEENTSGPRFFQRIAVEYEEDLRDLQSMYERNGSC